MSREAGYTLVEMLAALAVIGLAFGGLSAGSHILLRQQRGATSDVATSEAISSAQAALEGAFGKIKRNDIVAAEPRRVEVACNVGERCEATNAVRDSLISVTRTGGDHVAVTAATGYRFSYLTTAGPVPRWAAGSLDGLVAVTLTADSGRATPLAVLRLREEQAYRCEYDVIVASCREPAS